MENAVEFLKPTTTVRTKESGLISKLGLLRAALHSLTAEGRIS